MSKTHPKLYLAFVRHGEYKQKPQVPSALQPYGITNEGSEQALEAAIQIQKFAQEHDCEIRNTLISSTLLRAWQTADFIGQGLQVPYQIVESSQLVERSVGAMANLSVEEIEACLAADPRYSTPPDGWKSDSFYCLPYDGAESLMQAGQRVAHHIRDTFSELTQSVTQDTLQIMVGHGASFRHAAHVLGLLRFEEIAGLSMYYGVPLFFEYDAQDGAKGQWKMIGGEWKIRQSVLIDCPTID